MANETLADRTFDQLVDFGVKEIVEQVLGGKKSLRSAVYWISDVSARWGKETFERRQANELLERRSRRKNKKG